MSASLDHHLKKLSLDITMNGVSEEVIDALCSQLMQKHVQYRLMDRNQLLVDIRSSVERTTQQNAIGSIPKQLSSSFPSTDSLNKSISLKYTAKRSRATTEIVPGDADNEMPVDATPAAEVLSLQAAADGAATNEDSQPSKKPTIKVKKRLAESAIAGSSMNKSLLRAPVSFLTSRPTARLSDLAGLDSVLQQIKELVFFPVLYPRLYSHLGVRPPCGILLHGPSGCGKTTLASAIAGELNLPFFKASGPELVGGTSGESEERIRQIFEAAAAQAPSVLFIDSLDVLAGKASSRGMERRIVAQLESSIDYLNSLSGPQSPDGEVSDDKINRSEGKAAADGAASENAAPKPTGIVVLIVATNKPDSIDQGVRGRFSKEIALPVPDAPSRTKILRLMTSRMQVAPSVDFDALGKATPGFVGADLQALTREAGMIAVSRIVLASGASLGARSDQDGVNDLTGSVEMTDFTTAAKSIQPSAKREGFAVAPDVTWSDVGALAEVREELLHNVLEPIAHPERFRSLGLEVPAGVLFFGPPGCGKTLLAKALANQSGANFISVKGPELLNMYVGESESRVRQVFTRARASAPCVIFFDELDALCPKRGSGDGEGGGGGNGVSERVVNQLLTELDGLESRRDVYIIAATNRLELIDDAMLRPGRLGKLLYVPLPSAPDRVSILKALTRKVSVNLLRDGEDASNQGDDWVDLQAIGSDVRCEGFSGADLAALVREAGLAVVREVIDANNAGTIDATEMNNYNALGSATDAETAAAMNVDVDVNEGPTGSKVGEPPAAAPHQRHSADQYENLSICRRHFQMAFTKVKASVSESDRTRYTIVQENIKSGMGAIQALKDAAERVNRLKRLSIKAQSAIGGAEK